METWAPGAGVPREPESSISGFEDGLCQRGNDLARASRGTVVRSP